MNEGQAFVTSHMHYRYCSSKKYFFKHLLLHVRECVVAVDAASNTIMPNQLSLSLCAWARVRVCCENNFYLYFVLGFRDQWLGSQTCFPLLPTNISGGRMICCNSDGESTSAVYHDGFDRRCSHEWSSPG